MIERNEVKKLAELARIKLSDTEVENIRKDIDSILAFVSQIDSVSTSNTSPSYTNLKNVMREDGKPHETGLFSKELLGGVPERDGDYVKVKKIL
jgi:aspartyl-tRNA(Asn)/glutamyl-tRNA(Gln) amidotransferase subunit C